MPATKGEAITFKRGKYKGCTGWRNADKANTSHRTYVIVSMVGRGEKETYVKSRSVAAPCAATTDYAEAMLVQHPDIEGLVDQLCFEIARCNIAENLRADPQPLHFAIHKRMLQAMTDQTNLGGRATWRIVNYEAMEPDDEDGNI